MGEGVSFAIALEAYHDRAATENHLHQLLSRARAEPDKAKRGLMLAQAAIDQAQFYTRGIKRGATDPLDPELFQEFTKPAGADPQEQKPHE